MDELEDFEWPAYQVQVFAKAPVAGNVKTRLMPVLNAEQCAALHARLVEYTLSRLVAAAIAPVRLAGADDHPWLAALARGYRVRFVRQRGADLGERMHYAVANGLAESRGVILVGSDCPFLDASLIGRTIAWLEEGVPVVIGPASDGGYVLIGMRCPPTGLFDHIDWGSDRVLPQTRQRLRQRRLQWRELPVQRDIDRPGDLAALQALPDLWQCNSLDFLRKLD